MPSNSGNTIEWFKKDAVFNWNAVLLTEMLTEFDFIPLIFLTFVFY